MQREALVRYLDDALRISEIADYGPQGLQIRRAGAGRQSCRAGGTRTNPACRLRWSGTPT